MKHIKLLLFSILSGTFFSLAWPSIGGISFLLFIAFIPLLWVERELAEKKRSALMVFAHAYLAFFVFNFSSTWWIKNADLMGASMAIICNSFFLSAVFGLFHFSKKHIGAKEGYWALFIYWIAFEYLHLNWELSWSWLNLGNGLATSIQSIQWYEYTGILGGTAWILAINLMLFQLMLAQDKKKKIRFGVLAVLFLGIPLMLSHLIYSNYQEQGEEYHFVVVQPNIDPYREKFGGMAPSDQIDRMVNLASQKLSPETDYLVFPETAFPEAYWEHEIEYLYGTEELRKLIAQYPKLKIVVGMSTSILYPKGSVLTETANSFGDGTHYDNYNTAIQLDSSTFVPFHHKSKLVLGVEKLPFVHSIPLMKRLSINLGGASGGLGTQEIPSVFNSSDKKTKVAPIICYESIFGEYVTQYTNQGANLFTIITNDGWWGDTPGYHQHLSFASLRAIENRRSIARSANTGTSAFINQKGEISQATAWWEQAVIEATLKSNEKLTFYVRYGDYIGRTMAFVAPLLLLLAFVRKMNKTAARLRGKRE